MAAFLTPELATTELPSSDAFNSSQLMRPQTSTHDRRSKSDRVFAGRRALRVLVVNDEQESADALARLVRRWGHAARVAFDCLAVSRVAAVPDPDVVLLDMEMPLMDGCRVARHLRTDCPSNDCLIIGVTERADDARRQRCIEAGIDLLLIKPVDPDVVETLLMLECVHVNRSQTINTAGLAKKGSSPFARKKPSPVERKSAAKKTSGSRLVVALRADKQP